MMLRSKRLLPMALLTSFTAAAALAALGRGVGPLLPAAAAGAKDEEPPAKPGPAKPREAAGKKAADKKKTARNEGDKKKEAEKKEGEKKEGEEAEKKDGPEESDAGKKDPDAPAGTEKTEAAGAAPSNPDQEYVKTHLKDHLHGTVAFAPDGTVTIQYDLRSKKEEFQTDFLPPISAKPSAPFRWSIYQEEHVIGGDYGARISDRGAAFLNLWFVDDVEATAVFLQGITWTRRQVCAVAFQAKNGKAIANNYGGQCATFQGGAFQGGNPPTAETTVFNNTVKIGLRLKGGAFEALREGKPRSSGKYLPKNFSSGRVGIIWGGNLAGTLTSFTVKGKIDFAAMAREMRKTSGVR